MGLEKILTLQVKKLTNSILIFMTMKFKTLFVTALAAVTLGASAQNDKPKYEFNPYWSVQLQGGAGYTVGGADKFTDLITPAAAVSVGYRFAPAVGARLHLSGWQGKGGWDKGTQTYEWTYGQAGLDAVVDLCSIFKGYNPNRCVNVNAIVGLGYIRGFENDDAMAWNKSGSKPQFRNLWNDNVDLLAGRAGLQVDFRLNKRLSLNVEGLMTATGEKFNSKSGDDMDYLFNAFGGVTYRFGNFDAEPVNTYVPAPVVPAPAPKPEPAPAPKPAPKPAPAPAPKPAPAPVKKELTQNVFFQINSAKISATELIKVNEVVAFLKQNPETKVAITGYADKGTGNATINKRISIQRSNAVFKELVKQGIAAGRIMKDAKGDTVQPFKNNDDNRVVICIAE